MKITSFLMINNDGPEIASTNFWDHELGVNKIAFSVQEGCMRLLVPNNHKSALPDMMACEYVIASRLKSIRQNAFAIELLFEDHSQSPFCIHLSPEACLGLFPTADVGKVERKLTIWTQGPSKVAELPLFIRNVPRLPWMKPLS